MKLSDIVEKGYLTEDELFEMANVSTDETGLAVYVFVSPKGNAQHGCRIKVCNTRGNMNPQDLFTLTVPDFFVIGNCKLHQSDLDDVIDWVKLNQGLIFQYWNSKINTGTFFSSIRKL